MFDPTKRLTAEEGLKHPWLKRNIVKEKLKENEIVVLNVINDSIECGSSRSLGRVNSLKSLSIASKTPTS